MVVEDVVAVTVLYSLRVEICRQGRKRKHHHALNITPCTHTLLLKLLLVSSFQEKFPILVGKADLKKSYHSHMCTEQVDQVSLKGLAG